MAYIRTIKNMDGTTTYHVEVKLKGHPVVRQSFRRKTDANRWAVETEAAIRQRRYFGSMEGMKHTFSEMVERYITYELPKRHSDQQKFKSHLAWWNKHLGRYLLVDITPQMVSELRDKLSAEWIKKGPKAPEVQRKPATVKLYLATLSIVFSVAQKDWGWMEANPVKETRKPRVDNARTRYLSEEEQDALLSAALKDSNPHIYDFILLAICTGARWSELSHLMWRNVAFKAERPAMILEKTKNGDSRRVPLTGPALSLLRRRRQSSELKSLYVFPTVSGDRPMQLRKAWERVLEQSGINDFTFHDLRHTTASYLANNGAGLHEIGKILGHKTTAMTQRYSHLTDQFTHDVMERMTAKHFKDYENVFVGKS